MGQKINPDSMRLGTNKTWKSGWYTDDKKLYRQQLLQDAQIRDFLRERLASAGLERIDIARSSNMVSVMVYVARPGVAIGRGGEGIDRIKKTLHQKYRTPIDLKINEIKKADLSARVIARNIVEGMERRRSPKQLMAAERDKAMAAGARGIKIWISGTFGVPKQGRTVKLEEGVIPLQTIRADIDYASDAAQVRNAGLHGVKVWVYRPSEEPKKDK
ncbi:MAG: 30S ribosomal protein S3 [Candidatus Dojkabacteria bacterium]|nr:30S ribosomal protein S3 [Candidatus Dojkabacteria bacterium]